MQHRFKRTVLDAVGNLDRLADAVGACGAARQLLRAQLARRSEKVLCRFGRLARLAHNLGRRRLLGASLGSSLNASTEKRVLHIFMIVFI